MHYLTGRVYERRNQGCRVACLCGNTSETADGGIDAGSPLLCDGKDAGEQCDSGVCWFASGTQIECYATCSNVGASCEKGTCYLIGRPSLMACMPACDGCDISGECGTASDCSAGWQCLSQGGTKNCYMICTVDKPCATGICTDTELGFSVCIVEETGTTKIGEPCQTASSCVSGAQCLERNNEKRCYQVCDDTATCTTGTCTDTGLGFSACFADTTDGGV